MVSVAKGSFATAINCMDGRVQLPVIEYLRRKYNVDYVDMITEPGPIKILAEGREESLIASIRKRVEISVGKHGSRYVAVVGHYDCAGNPVAKDVQVEQIRASMKVVRSWGFQGELIGLWVDENWKVSEVELIS